MATLKLILSISLILQMATPMAFGQTPPPVTAPSPQPAGVAIESPSTVHGPGLTEERARAALRKVRAAIRSKRYVLGQLALGFGFTSVFVTLLHSMNPASVVRVIGLRAWSLATMGLGYWLISASEADTGTLADPYLQSAEGMHSFILIKDEDLQLNLMRSDRRLVEAVMALNERYEQLEKRKPSVQTAAAEDMGY